MKKAFACLLAVLMLTTLLAACGGDASSSTPDAPPASTAATPDSSAAADLEPAALEGDIVFWHSFTQGPRMESIQKSADDFMAENPGVNITIETFSWADFYTKWTTGFSSGNLPDLSTALPNHVVEMIDADAIVPMDDLIDKMGRDRFYEAPLTEMTLNGACYAVPIYSHAQVMWYRKDLLAENNLEIPQTWDDLRAAAETLNSPPDLYGCSVPLGLGDMMGTRYLNFYVRSAGETLITEDGKANLTSQAAIDGINFWVDMYNTASPADSINYVVLDQATLYYQGKNAFDFNSAFQIGGVESNRPDLMDQIDCAPMPRVSESDPVRGYETSNIPLVVWKQSENQDVSKAFIEYLYEPERYIEFLHSVPVGMMPALKEITTDERFLGNETVQKFQNAMEVIGEALSTGTAIGMEHGPRPEAGLLTSQGVIEEMFHNIILNGTDVETAAKAAEDKLNDLFETVG